MKKAILTGFGPFGGYNYNPTQDLALEFNGKSIGDVLVRGVVLPCTYYGGYDLLAKTMSDFAPNIILGMGLASRVPRIRMEVAGRNLMNGKYADANGEKPINDPIVIGDRKNYLTNANEFALTGKLRNAGIESDISFDADSFICNSLIYLTARHITRGLLPVKFAFFHIPWTDDYKDRIQLEVGKVWINKGRVRETIEILLKNM